MGLGEVSWTETVIGEVSWTETGIGASISGGGSSLEMNSTGRSVGTEWLGPVVDFMTRAGIGTSKVSLSETGIVEVAVGVGYSRESFSGNS